ncbi:B12-binding domain-containing radical SAM protein [Lacrimispora sp. 210928-DFI.3.58]|uniref:B12-binding domain-containing radical SAM protein n=1 Tax=Lacrimispora sp. 210928-DFI.3.58 TaxID=2883214 RepID=UPI001D060710|nr:B12-binding domain-containing radical SAM protein [Lacrimispora sp. 210928-DFI.3.58]MCB7319155.1 B12-binding domain-containing radical SAM protein [Lacrimispora sp. 210928-DFI.3.58]
MKVLLAAVNAKYIHSNLGIYSLKAYARKALGIQEGGRASGPSPISIDLAEYTINHQTETILQDIYKRKPDFIGFSCYIWNISCIKALLPDIKKVLPNVQIWLGGPEVSYDGEQVLKDYPEAEGIMKGEGESVFAQLLCAKMKGKPLSGVPGLLWRTSDEAIEDTGSCQLIDLDEIPFPYAAMDMKELEHRIIYYESSRGCPFSCSYCLSSIDKRVRFRSPELVKEELSFFLKAHVPQVKFVDRTFNCKKSHAMAVWQYILEHDNGITNFHFEIAADLLDEEELALLSAMRPGLIQLEIGVQSTNQRTLEAIRRKTDIGEIRRITSSINRGRNIHQHLDLIAGLPYEDLASFRRSFNQVYSMEPEQLQLGFLKVLKGSYMGETAASHRICYSSAPPYEVLSTRWLSYDDILELKGIEEMVEVYYNSRQFTTTIAYMEDLFDTPYQMFFHISRYYQAHGLQEVSHSRLARYEILFRMLEETVSPERLEILRDTMMTDLYLRENIKKRPSFARDQSEYKDRIRVFFEQEYAAPHYLTEYTGYDARQMSKMAHIEVMGNGKMLLFDYKKRDPLTNNAIMYELQPASGSDMTISSIH